MKPASFVVVCALAEISLALGTPQKPNVLQKNVASWVKRQPRPVRSNGTSPNVSTGDAPLGAPENDVPGGWQGAPAPSPVALPLSGAPLAASSAAPSEAAPSEAAPSEPAPSELAASRPGSSQAAISEPASTGAESSAPRTSSAVGSAADTAASGVATPTDSATAIDAMDESPATDTAMTTGESTAFPTMAFNAAQSSVALKANNTTDDDTKPDNKSSSKAKSSSKHKSSKKSSSTEAAGGMSQTQEVNINLVQDIVIANPGKKPLTTVIYKPVHCPGKSKPCHIKPPAVSVTPAHITVPPGQTITTPGFTAPAQVTPAPGPAPAPKPPAQVPAQQKPHRALPQVNSGSRLVSDVFTVAVLFAWHFVF